MTHAFLISGFVLIVVGVAQWSLAGGCVVAGAILFVAGGRAAAREGK